MSNLLASDADLLNAIEAFCAKHGMGVTTFGRNALGDANLVANMRAGRSLTLKTADKVRRFMREYRTETRADAA